MSQPYSSLPKEPVTILEFLNCTDIICTDPASLQFALCLSPGEYIYFQSVYACFPQKALKQNPVFSQLSSYFSSPDTFLQDVQLGKLKHFLNESHWSFSKISYTQISDEIRNGIARTFGIDLSSCDNVEEYQQLICEGYFELYV